ncbi:hypothetical protein [Natrinema sp. 74]|uniref:hypothetical protein n=1 Tax=Natrinema sp. 74 TaxID=3384159 RepID=UPI0038D40837
MAGTSAFAVCLAVLYQLAASMDAVGRFGSGENGPSRFVIAGLTDLVNHGVVLERGGEPIEIGVGSSNSAGFSSHVTALVLPLVLAAAGYLLVRSVRLETRREARLAIGSLVACYAVLTAGLATVARWTPQVADSEPNAEAIGAPIDFGTLLTISRTAFTFAVIGAVVAALPRLLASSELLELDR